MVGGAEFWGANTSIPKGRGSLSFFVRCIHVHKTTFKVRKCLEACILFFLSFFLSLFWVFLSFFFVFLSLFVLFSFFFWILMLCLRYLSFHKCHYGKMMSQLRYSRPTSTDNQENSANYCLYLSSIFRKVLH